MRIAYDGYSADLDAPGDRRRFCVYAHERGIEFEKARLDQPYDVVYITHGSDLPGWIARKRREGSSLRLIFELVDSYFTYSDRSYRFAKGLGRYALGIDSRPSLDYRRLLAEACSVSDAVICSTVEQQTTIRKYNSNVFVSFDSFSNDFEVCKKEYTRRGRLKVVWEGMSTTLDNLVQLSATLNKHRDKIELHIVTDSKTYKLFNRFLVSDTVSRLGVFDCPVYFHPWDKKTFVRQIISSDLAIIPIDLANPMANGKPENKLVSFWLLGMPVLTSPTPAYKRAMNEAGIAMICNDTEEWNSRLADWINASESEFYELGHRVQQFALNQYSMARFVKPFDDAFAAVGFKPC